METTKKTVKWMVEEFRKGNMLVYDGTPIEDDESIQNIPDVQIVDWYNWGEIYHKSEQMR